jgi:hypothetical protein
MSQLVKGNARLSRRTDQRVARSKVALTRYAAVGSMDPRPTINGVRHYSSVLVGAVETLSASSNARGAVWSTTPDANRPPSSSRNPLQMAASPRLEYAAALISMPATVRRRSPSPPRVARPCRRVRTKYCSQDRRIDQVPLRAALASGRHPRRPAQPVRRSRLPRRMATRRREHTSTFAVAPVRASAHDQERGRERGRTWQGEAWLFVSRLRDGGSLG